MLTFLHKQLSEAILKDIEELDNDEVRSMLMAVVVVHPDAVLHAVAALKEFIDGDDELSRQFHAGRN